MIAPQKPKADAAGQILTQREGNIGAEHIEGAVGEIDDPAHAENDRQPAGGEKQRRCAGQAGDELIEDESHRLDLARRGNGQCLPTRQFCGRSDDTSLSAGRYFAPSR